MVGLKNALVVGVFVLCSLGFAAVPASADSNQIGVDEHHSTSTPVLPSPDEHHSTFLPQSA